MYRLAIELRWVTLRLYGITMLLHELTLLLHGLTLLLLVQRPIPFASQPRLVAECIKVRYTQLFS